MTRSKGRPGRLTAASATGLLLAALTACSGGYAATTPTATSTPDLPRLIACLHRHGISVPAHSDVQAIRTALKSAGKTRKKAAASACRQYAGSRLGNKAGATSKG